MNVFRGLCAAAAMGLMVATAFPQGDLNQRNRGDSGGNKGSGGPTVGSGQSNPPRTGGGSSNDRTSPPARIGGGNEQRDRSGPPARVGGGNDNRDRSGPPTRTGGGNDNRDRSGPPTRVGGGNDNRDRSGPPTRIGGGNEQRDRSGPPTRIGGGDGDRTGPPARIGGGGDGDRSRPPTRIGGGDNDRSGPPTRIGGGDNDRSGPPTRIGGGQTGAGDVGRGRDRNGPPTTIGGGNTGGQGGSGDVGRGRNGSGSTRWPVTITGGTNQVGQGGGGDILRRRSGSSSYGTDNNIARKVRIDRPSVPRAPHEIRGGDLGEKVRRKDHPTLIIGGYRSGYYWYDGNWCDDNFWYRYYCFDPWDHVCISPWYYYFFLPAYVSYNRCHFYRFDPWNNWYGDYYQWRRPDYGSYDYWGRGNFNDVDYAVEDIIDAFERADRRAVDRLIPQSSEVAIYIDGDYSYSLNAGDFYDMFMDATQNTKTIRYRILDVKRGRDSVRVTARHEYEDPWGSQTSVTHYYELRYEGRNLVISKFGISGGGDRW